MTDNKPLPEGATCQAPTASSKPCRNTIGLAWHGAKIMCAPHAAKAKRDAVKDTGKPKRIRARKATTDQDTRACSATTKKGEPCQVKQGLQRVGGEVLCPAHRAKRKRDSRGGVRNSPRKHAAKCLICQSPHRTELEQAYVDGAVSATRLGQSVGGTRWTVYRHVKYFQLDHERAQNVLPFLGRIIARGHLNNPTARDAVAAIIAVYKITGGVKAQIDKRMSELEAKYAQAVVAMLDRLGLEAELYKRAGEIMQEEMNRQTGISTDESIDGWNLEDDTEPDEGKQH